MKWRHSVVSLSRPSKNIRQVSFDMSTVEKTFQDAVTAMNSGRPVDAEQLFKKLLKRVPDNVAVLNLLTVVLVSMDRHAEAEAFISKAIRLTGVRMSPITTTA